MRRFSLEMLHLRGQTLAISEALWPRDLPHQLRRRRLTKLISEFSALWENNQGKEDCKKGKGHQNRAPSLLEPRVFFSRVFGASIRGPRASIRAP